MKLLSFRKYYRCGMVSLIGIPILFFLYLKTSNYFKPQQGIEITSLDEWEGVDIEKQVYYLPIFPNVNKFDTLKISKGFNYLLNNRIQLQSNMGLCLIVKDESDYSDLVFVLNECLKRNLVIYQISPSQFHVYHKSERQYQKRDLLIEGLNFSDTYDWEKPSILEKIILELNQFKYRCLFYYDIFRNSNMLFEVSVLLFLFFLIFLIGLGQIKAAINKSHKLQTPT